jgi:large subunit ribosomal protein L41
LESGNIFKEEKIDFTQRRMNALLIGRRCVLSGQQATNAAGHNLLQIASFSKYISKSRTKRLPLTTKRAGKGFYKGNGARKEGLISSKARFTPVAEMITELVVPDLTNFKLKAYVGPGAKRHIIEKNVNLKINPF